MNTKPSHFFHAVLSAFCFAVLAVVFVLCFDVAHSRPVYSAEAEKEELFHIKSVKGTVAARTRYNLSVETGQEGGTVFEMVLPLNDKTKLQGYESISEIERGDVIAAKFKEKYELDEAGEERVTASMATEISVVRSSSSNKLVSKEAGE